MSMATVRQAPIGQWVLLGLGAFYVANPEKFIHSFQRGASFFVEPSSSSGQQPIVIHNLGGAGSNKPIVGYLIQLTVGAGFCWGSYMILVNILPEACLKMLPLTKAVFHKAVSSLGESIINVREALMEQIFGLSEKQQELSEKQDETHNEVLFIKGDVQDLSGSLSSARETLDVCQESLTEAEKRQSYIARGVRLLTRGVSSMVPQDASLAYELDKYNKDGVELNESTPLQKFRQQRAENPLQSTPAMRRMNSASRMEDRDMRHVTPMMKRSVMRNELMRTAPAPESEHPASPVSREDLDDIRALLDMVRSGSLQQVNA